MDVSFTIIISFENSIEINDVHNFFYKSEISISGIFTIEYIY